MEHKARTGYLIDPEKNRVTEVTFTDLHSIYRLLDCDNIEAAPLRNGEAIYVDGDFPPGHHNWYFKIRGYPQWLAGKGLYIGPADRDGNELPPITPRKIVRANVKCADSQTVALIYAFLNAREL